MKPTLPPRLVKVRQLSLAFRLVCRVLFVLTVLLGIGLAVPYLLLYQPGVGAKPGAYAVGVMVIGLVSLAYWAAGLWVLERLFSVFVTGRVLDPNSGRWLKWFGFWVATALLLPIGMRMTLDWAAFGRLGAIREGPFAPAIGCFLLGLFLMMLGWVLEEASEPQAEQDLTV